MKIGKNRCASILIIGPQDEFIACITDEDIFMKKEYEVQLLGNKNIKLSIVEAKG